jgi:gamma-glutamyl:cysteine ligase YbdK (ATP-grasp superfamily)
MGQDLSSSRFTRQDFKLFERQLQQETEELQHWFNDGVFVTEGLTAGFEMEAWLIDSDQRPAPVNEAFFRRSRSPMIVPELAKFNIEFNVEPQPLSGAALAKLRDEINRTTSLCYDIAAQMDIDVVMMGILPTLTETDLTLANMSQTERFRALNEQVLRQRRGQPLNLMIQGAEHLRVSHFDVMLESAATSFQIHLQVPPDQAARYYNAACIVSAPLVAACANSPYFYGKDLWDETRIPLFEQSVALQGCDTSDCEALRRVTFGNAYIGKSLFEAFAENLRCFPVLLPARLDDTTAMAHVRLHNGTIWRWNRPLIGFDERGRPHLRIEQRVVPAGPTVVDSIANAAFYYGLVHELAMQDCPPESQLPFPVARENFYKAARLGLRASIPWLDGKTQPLTHLIVDTLLPQARNGLERLDIRRDDIEDYLGIIEARVRSGRNGAGWQRAYVAKFGLDAAPLTATYLANQKHGAPVHEWTL